MAPNTTLFVSSFSSRLLVAARRLTHDGAATGTAGLEAARDRRLIERQPMDGHAGGLPVSGDVRN
jgi:hypothetical protein